MRYYLIVGEASGDLHAANLMKAIQKEDAAAEFRYFGGDLMTAVGGERVKHYKELAYMGFIPVLLHLRTIFSNMRQCKEDIVAWHPDVVILVDYPGFNLSIAKYLKANTRIPVFYYISPKIWAWKEHRIKNIKRDVAELFSILPFEVPFFRGYGYPIHYVGNPTVDEIAHFNAVDTTTPASFAAKHNLSSQPIIALLAGSRKQEIKDNLPRMIAAAREMEGHQMVLAGAPSISPEFYEPFVKGTGVTVVYGETYPLLRVAKGALVTSGTATLETALFRVPQVVCYHLPVGKVYSLLRRLLLKVKYVSLVNLVADKEIVKELVADGMTAGNAAACLRPLLYDEQARSEMLAEYDRMIAILGAPGAPARAAREMVSLLR